VDGFQDSTKVVVVADPPKAILWAFNSTTVIEGGTVSVGLSLTTPAGPEEPKTIEIRSRDDDLAQAIPNTVTIPVGSSAASVVIHGFKEGRTVLEARDAGGQGQSYDDAELTVDVVSQPDLRLNAQYKNLLLYLGAPAVPVPVHTVDEKGPAQIKDPIAVGDTSSAPGVVIGDAPVKTIDAGGSFVVFYLTGLKAGSAAVAYSSPGYRPDTTHVTVDMASLVLSAGVSVGIGRTRSTVSIPFSAPAPITVTLQVTGLGLQVPQTVTIERNSSSASFDVTGLAGIGTVTASAPGFRDAVSVNISVLGL